MDDFGCIAGLPVYVNELGKSVQFKFPRRRTKRLLKKFISNKRCWKTVPDLSYYIQKRNGLPIAIYCGSAEALEILKRAIPSRRVYAV